MQQYKKQKSEDSLKICSISILYTKFKKVTNNITKETVGFRRSKHVEGLSPEIELACDQRRRATVSLLENPSDLAKKQQYKTFNTAVKKAVKQQKNKVLLE